jgi:hypothetical protein
LRALRRCHLLGKQESKQISFEAKVLAAVGAWLRIMEKEGGRFLAVTSTRHRVGDGLELGDLFLN